MEELFNLPLESQATQEILEQFLKYRIVVFNEGVTSDVLENIILHIIRWNKEDEEAGIVLSKRKPIWIYIQSPGGSVISGFSLIDVMLASKTPIYTLCFGQCVSMGFYIFIAGHKRFAFKNSILMLHDGDISISNSTSKAKDTMKFFDIMEERNKDFIITHTNMDSDFYDSIYDKEYYMYANDEGKCFGCVDYIVGEDIELNELFTKKF